MMTSNDLNTLGYLISFLFGRGKRGRGKETRRELSIKILPRKNYKIIDEDRERGEKGEKRSG